MESGFILTGGIRLFTLSRGTTEPSLAAERDPARTTSGPSFESTVRCFPGRQFVPAGIERPRSGDLIGTGARLDFLVQQRTNFAVEVRRIRSAKHHGQVVAVGPVCFGPEFF